MKKTIFLILMLLIISINCYAMGGIPQKKFSDLDQKLDHITGEAIDVIQLREHVSIDDYKVSSIYNDMLWNISLYNGSYGLRSGDYMYFFVTKNRSCSSTDRIKKASIFDAKIGQYESLTKDKLKTIGKISKAINDTDIRKKAFDIIYTKLSKENPTKYRIANRDKIYLSKIYRGLTKEETILSWGEPDDINKDVGSWGTNEQWVYGYRNSTYVYFENGILTSWQE